MLLIKKPAKVGDIITFKITTAEEVIARLVEETDEYFKLERPLTLSYTAQGVGMTPWFITAEPDAIVELPKKRVIAHTPTMKQAADQYIQGTTGIKVVG